jgi:dihydroorotase/N-acyl-D-amino-acid deacylase
LPLTRPLRAGIDADHGGWENPVRGAGWDGVVVGSSRSGAYDGLALTEIAARLGGDPFDALVHVLTTEELEASMIVHSMHEDDVSAVLRHHGP